MTRYWYEVTISKCVDIDFQKIFDFVKKESKSTDIDSIYIQFLDNMGYYIRSVYNETDNDLIDEDNDCFFDEVQEGWEEFLEKEYDYK